MLPQNRMKAGVGLNRHDVVGTETTKEHGVVADVAAHVEVDPPRSYHSDVLELIDFPERLLSADDVRSCRRRRGPPGARARACRHQTTMRCR